ncbi:autotransporter outer membrane beta-barrel domain-containing protein [Pelagerythrobacter rhizovicinus]|uniref:Autotransporter outer membrane beta-barrel domain-containing protein n=1 Tax=Pelagerythrobacter rhizovicinus TaxID=2268576 RepID=A0A4Q2KMV3_9SPHN|nr:autotransporter outer membrane beta-barrel domain-containing protein [Pelagerythrobacter rhizovicinus]RXZ65600.1 autotransporter outer membrane beta-barrel domain-containing protein [Pelagerythrobacter rhizovicinus]
MHRYLLATTAIAALATPLSAQTVISDDRTQPVRTSTIKNGSPDSIRIDKNGSVVVSSGTAVTMDSNHGVTNEGEIKITNANGATGIAVAAGTTGDIVNSGTITIDETYTPEDIDKDGDLDGPFAVGTGRAGIRTQGAHTGDLSNSGKIVVEGNDSAGIALGGPLTGDFTHNGETSVLGSNSVAVSAQDITGDVRLAGKVTAQGEGAVGAHFAGDVDGAMVVQGQVSSTGYRYPTPPSNASKLDADDKLQGGSALVIEGNVTGGIVLAAAPKDADKDDADEDKDGIPDANEGTAAIVSAGEAPAMVIGAADRDIAIGAVAGSGNNFGVIIEGSITGDGVYAGVDGNGLVIGGRGGAVSIAGGIANSGTIGAKSVDASATALRIGADATVPEIRNSGTIGASSGKTEDSIATAIVIDEGADVDTVRNSGTIKAAVSGKDGAATAIIDRSGGVELVENSGVITAEGADAASGRNVAIDLTANATGATVRQTAVASGKDAPSIKGDVRFGAGDDVFEIADGTVSGNVTFGAGSNELALSGDAKQTGTVTFGGGGDTMSLAGSSVFDGTADFGGGADVLTLAGSARFSGTLTNAGNLAVTVSGGVLDLSRPTSIGSLEVGSGAILNVTLDKDAGEGTLIDVAGTASFDEDSKLRFRLADIDEAEGRYVVLTAGDLQIGDELTGDNTLLPFMYKATIDADETANELAVEIGRKTTTELGLNRSQSTAYDAILDALGEDDEIADVFLNITDGEAFRDTVTLMLPDHAGGAFEGVSLGTRTMARFLTDPQGPIEPSSKIHLIFDAGGWGSNKDEGDTAAYDQSGLGFAAGAEIATGLGRFGGTITYLWNRHDIGDTSSVHSGTYELAAHWVGKWGGLQTFARAGIGMVNFEGTRYFDATVGEDIISRDVEREWDGTVTSFMGGASFEGGGQFFFFRPSVVLDYVRLKEDGYTDTGGGAGLNLTVAERTSDEFAVNGGLTLGVDLKGMRARDASWFRIEGEGGWREILGGGLGDTTAQFEDGDPFTLQAEQSVNGWYARLRAIGGDEAFTISGEAGAEERHNDVGFTLRGTIRMGF